MVCHGRLTKTQRYSVDGDPKAASHHISEAKVSMIIIILKESGIF